MLEKVSEASISAAICGRQELLASRKWQSMAHERAHEGVVFLSSQLGVQMYRNKPKSCESKLVAEM